MTTEISYAEIGRTGDDYVAAIAFGSRYQLQILRDASSPL
jgi:hypothetical protein